MEEIYEDDLIDRYVKDLTPIELDFLENEDNELNTCNKCEIIKHTWATDEFKWDCDHDLKGHTALCSDCYFELGCKSFHHSDHIHASYILDITTLGIHHYRQGFYLQINQYQKK